MFYVDDKRRRQRKSITLYAFEGVVLIHLIKTYYRTDFTVLFLVGVMHPDVWLRFFAVIISVQKFTIRNPIACCHRGDPSNEYRYNNLCADLSLMLPAPTFSPSTSSTCSFFCRPLRRCHL